MATGLMRRVRVLEETGGVDQCSRCSGVLVVLIGREFSSASRRGKGMSEEEYREFEAEEDEEGRCPVCRGKATEITLRWPEDAA